MTQSEKYQIEIFRAQGIGYTEIAKKMGISVNSIKTYCRRHDLGGKRGYVAAGPINVCACENCGKPVIQNAGRKKKRFCCDRCRNEYWNSHLDQVNRKANYEVICKNCGKTFIAYGNKNRKYCCHDCYLEDRFGGAC
ncbi:LIM domain protein [Butyrivibrio sp. AD3002]|uniref:LIM domain protein n=1 Tax=Butyrivibrio sp. AD3002 TaxID=1280670 RepID=UPI0003B6567E|nr:LIM domain protein [Butyrivibrio sp. AD3002]